MTHTEIRFYREYGRNGEPDMFYRTTVMEHVPRVGEYIDLYAVHGHQDAPSGIVTTIRHCPIHPTGAHIQVIVRIAPACQIGSFAPVT